MARKYIVSLTEAERDSLLALTKKGSLPARKLNRAHILLQADAGARGPRETVPDIFSSQGAERESSTPVY